MDLANLSRAHAEFLRQGISVTNDDLRQHGLRRHLENKQAALFASFVSQAILKTPIAYAMIEDEDYDCVLWWKTGDRSGYARVQLKEIVPRDLNPSASIESELAKLSKYPTSGQTLIAVHVNQEGPLNFSSTAPPGTAVAEIWLYAATAPDQSRWVLYGDLLSRPQEYDVSWPRPYS